MNTNNHHSVRHDDPAQLQALHGLIMRTHKQAMQAGSFPISALTSDPGELATYREYCAHLLTLYRVSRRLIDIDLGRSDESREDVERELAEELPRLGPLTDAANHVAIKRGIQYAFKNL